MPRTGPTRRALPALLLLLLPLLAGACGGAEDGSLAGVTRDPPLDVGAVSLPEVDADGAVTDFALQARPGGLLVVFFGYTHCPDVCPTTLADLSTGLARLGDDAERVDVAFVTVDPDRDTPEVLHGFLSHFVDRYHVLRTEDADALAAAEAALLVTSSVTEAPDGEVEVVHTGTTFVVDEAGAVLVEWPFGTPNTTYSEDLRLLLDGEAT